MATVVSRCIAEMKCNFPQKHVLFTLPAAWPYYNNCYAGQEVDYFNWYQMYFYQSVLGFTVEILLQKRSRTESINVQMLHKVTAHTLISVGVPWLLRRGNFFTRAFAMLLLPPFFFPPLLLEPKRSSWPCEKLLLDLNQGSLNFYPVTFFWTEYIHLPSNCN